MDGPDRVAHYVLAIDDLGRAHASIARGHWPLGPDERHRDALRPGDTLLLYVGGAHRVFLERAEVAPARRSSPPGVPLEGVRPWDPPVPMAEVLARLDPAENASADLRAGLDRITGPEHTAVLTAAAEVSPARPGSA